MNTFHDAVYHGKVKKLTTWVSFYMIVIVMGNMFE